MKKPFIFITNDDGVNARGLKAVTEVALRFGRVVVIAPETTQSGMAHAVTMYSPLYLRTVEKRGDLTVYACSGTPVDCVKMGYDHILRGRTAGPQYLRHQPRFQLGGQHSLLRDDGSGHRSEFLRGPIRGPFR